MEDRRLLSVASGGGPEVALVGGGCPVPWDTVIHDSDGDLFAFDLAAGASGDPLVYLGQTLDPDLGSDPEDQLVVLDDMAYSPLEDLYYGVTWSSDYGTSLLYRITIDTCVAPPTVATQRVKITGNDGYLWADAAWPDGNEVNLNALEFTNDGTRLFAAGTYDSSVDYDWTFEIDISMLRATKHVALQADGRDYHSAGDLEFDASGDMYVTTNDDYLNQRGELLKIEDPLSASPTADRVGLTGYTDLYGLTYDSYNRLVGYLSTSHESPPVAHRRSAQTIDEDNGDAQHLRWLIYEDDVDQVYLDDIHGVATTLLPAGDFGDAPDPAYPTTVANNGASHAIVPGFYLGAGVDGESDGQPTAGADGDDNDADGDDEDGVLLPPQLVVNSTAQLTVTASAVGRLDAWIDFNGDGDWSDPGEQVFNNRALVAGGNPLSVAVPAEAQIGQTYARFRFSSAGGLSYTGSAPDGEVEDYQVEISNVILDGRTVNVFGRDDVDDVFEFIPGTDYTILINGDVHQFAAADVDEVVFHGYGGWDTAIFHGTADAETAKLWPDHAVFGGTGFLVTAQDVEAIDARMDAGSDTVWVYDSNQDDTLEVWPNSATVTEPGGSFSHQAGGFEVLLAYAKAGGSDTAILYDSPGDDIFESTPPVSWLTGAGFFNRVKFFEVVLAYAKSGGNDAALLRDTASNDVFQAWPGLAWMSGGGLFSRAKFFEYVHGYSKNGGVDAAFLYDSPGDDTLTATPVYARLTGPGLYNRAKYFDYVHAYAKYGGHDVAQMYDSPGDDVFVGQTTYGRLWAADSSFNNRAKFFEEGYALAPVDYPDNDTATLYSGTPWNTVGDWENIIGPLSAGGAGPSASALELAWWMASLDSAEADSQRDGDPEEPTWAVDFILE